MNSGVVGPLQNRRRESSGANHETEDGLWWREVASPACVALNFGVPCGKLWRTDCNAGQLQTGLDQLLRGLAVRVDTLLPSALVGL